MLSPNETSHNKKYVRSLLSDDLVHAVLKNDLFRLKLLRKSGRIFDSSDENKNTLLHIAVMKQRMKEKTLDVLHYLLSLNEVPRNSRNWRGNSPLMEAFMHNWYSQSYVVKLIESGCDISEKFDDRSTLLHWAAGNGWLQAIELLVNRGVEVDGSNRSSETALHWACESGHVDAVWLLLAYGADPNTAADVLEVERVHSTRRCCRVASYVPEVVETVTCFDMAARAADRPQLQELFFEHLCDGHASLNLRTFIKALDAEAVDFRRLVAAAASVSHTEDDAKQFCCKIRNHPEFFQIFMSKFELLVEEMFDVYELAPFDRGYVKNIQGFIKITFSIFDSTIAGSIVDQINAKNLPFVNYVIDVFDNKSGDVDVVTQMLLLLLSHGVDFNTLAMNQIYFKYGHCDLFKTLLHMDLSNVCTFTPTSTDCFCDYFEPNLDFSIFASTQFQELRNLTNLIIPQIIYDVKMKVPTTVENFAPILLNRLCDDLMRNIIRMFFAFFALSESVKNSIFDLSQVKSLFDGHACRMFMDSEQFPTLPTLIELSRNRTRDYIIERFDIQNSMQFYTILKTLQIPSDYKDIISFERNLYPLIKSTR